MLINALCNYYDRLLENPESGVSMPNFSKAKISHEIVLNVFGEIVNVIDLRVEENHKLYPRELDVPEQVKRSSGILPNFICENSTYALGIDKKGKPERAKVAFYAYRDFNIKLLESIDDEGAKAFVSYLKQWDPSKCMEHPVVRQYIEDLMGGSFFVFRLIGDSMYIHQRDEVISVWQAYKSGSASSIIGQCLVTGETGPIARLHPNIKGVTGAQSSGASIISFNLKSSESYGKEQGLNAPVSEKAAFAYTTALNYLLKSEKHRIRIGDTTTVFWAEKTSCSLEEDLLSGLINIESGKDEGQVDSEQKKIDPRTNRLVKDILTRAKQGQPLFKGMTEIDPEAEFYILGLSPNNSRLSIRFWYVDTFGSLVEKISMHYSNMEIVKPEYEQEYIPLWRILKEIAPLGDMNRLSPLLAGALMRSIITGAAYPQSIYTGMLSRIRSENEDRKDNKGKKDKINAVRAAVLKACIVRKAQFYNKSKKEVVSVSLDTKSESKGYRLGRLFALLEKAQQDANPGINATIKDRYFGAASATPGAVFPQLMRLSQHHISKSDFGFISDKRIEEVMEGIDSFPTHLNLDEQGMFMIGYYHQRHALYQKNEEMRDNNVK